MTKLTEIGGGADYPAPDEEVERALKEAAEEMDKSVGEVEEAVAHILGSGTGTITNEGVGGTSSDTDPRLEALKIWKMRQKL